MTAKNRARRCKAKAKSGKPCRAAATAGGLCFFHANPNKASELGRIGGRSNRHTTGATDDPLPILDTARAVRDMGNRLVAELYAGKIKPQVANGIERLLSLQLRAIDTSDLEQRVADLEQEVYRSREAGATGSDRDAVASKSANGTPISSNSRPHSSH